MWSRWSIGSSGWVSKHVKKHHPGPNTILKGWLFWREWYVRWDDFFLRTIGYDICMNHDFCSWSMCESNAISPFSGKFQPQQKWLESSEKKQPNLSLMNLLLPYSLIFPSHLRFTWYFLMIPVKVFISHFCYYMLYIPWDSAAPSFWGHLKRTFFFIRSDVFDAFWEKKVLAIMKGWYDIYIYTQYNIYYSNGRSQ